MLPCEGLPMLPLTHFYYTLKDIVIEVTKNKEGLTWSIHHLTHIFGFTHIWLLSLEIDECFRNTVCLHCHLQA